MGGVSLIDGFEYGISVQHTRPDFLQETTSPAECISPPCFGDESDDESIGQMEITSRGRYYTNLLHDTLLMIMSLDRNCNLRVR